MKRKQIKVLFAALFIFFTACGLALSLREENSEPVSRSEFLLDTFVTITIYDNSEPSILEQCIALCREYENRFSKTIPTSELYQINHRNPGEVSFSLSKDMESLIREGIRYSQLSEGAFDLTIEPLSSLWNFTDGNTVIPPAEDIRAATQRVGWENLRLNGNTLTILSPDTTIELGSIAKGFIADRLKEYLISKDVKSAIINLGGNVLCIGEKPDKTPFRIGLQKPFDTYNETIANLNISDLSVVSSGVYERHFIKDGKNYHHLLDPKTGYPLENGLISVTIVSPRSVDGDALSTACFSLGLEKGTALINSIDNIYGYFITEDYEIHYTNGAETLIQIKKQAGSQTGA